MMKPSILPRWWSLLSLLAALTLFSPSARAGFGSVWTPAKTDTSLTLNWSNLPSHLRYASGAPRYRVCYKVANTWVGACNGGAVVTSATKPLVIGGLTPCTSYKIKVFAYTERSILWSWGLKKYRLVGTLTVTTDCNSAGSLKVTDVGYTTIHGAAELSQPALYDLVRVSYRRKFFYDLYSHLGQFVDYHTVAVDRTAPPLAWGSSDCDRGWVDFSSPLHSNAFELNDVCCNTRYVVDLIVFLPGQSIGTFLDRSVVATKGTLWNWQCMGLIQMSTLQQTVGEDFAHNHADLLSTYAGALESYYCTSTAPGQCGSVQASILSLASFDAGAGLSLFAGGEHFTSAGGLSAQGLAAWSGTDWAPVGGNLDGAVRAQAVFDDGSGAALYVAGDFTTAAGIPVGHIARWDGAQWSALGSGLNGPVQALFVWDDGSGQALYAGGDFTAAGGVPANHVARFDGLAWSALGSGTNGPVHAMTAYNQGSGAKLIVGGDFTLAGGVGANHVARYDGTWTPVGTGIGGPVHALEVYLGPFGLRLFAGGDFTAAGGAPASHLAGFDFVDWVAIPGGGTDGPVHALRVHDDGSGSFPKLFVGGEFSLAGGQGASNVAGFHFPSGWSPVGAGTDGAVHALGSAAIGGQALLFAGGSLTYSGAAASNHIASWSGLDWAPLGSGLTRGVRAMFSSILRHVPGSSGFPFFAPGCCASCCKWEDEQFGIYHPEVDFEYALDWLLTAHAGGAVFWEWQANDLALASNGLLLWDFILAHVPELLDEGDAPGAVFCLGDGSAAACPCGNTDPGTGPLPAGCANSSGAGASLVATGNTSLSLAELVLEAGNLQPGQPGLYFQALNAVNGGLGVPFGDGLRCAGGQVARIQIRTANAAGNSHTTIDVGAAGGVAPGDVRRYQVWYRNPSASPCGSGFNLTNGLEVTWTP